MYTTFIWVVISATTLCLLRLIFRPPSNVKGPPCLPIIGNLLQVPVSHPWVRFAEWKKPYGDIIPLKIFGRRLFVLNSRAVAVELFEKRSAIYSERPQRQMANLCGFGKALLFHKYGEVVRKTRKLMHAEISRSAVSQHKELQEREVQNFVDRILRSPKTLHGDSQRLAASVILMISHGYKVNGPNDPFVSLAEQVMSYVEKVITPNNFLVDSLPILLYLPEWFPGAHFKLEAKICRELLNRLMIEPYLMVVKQLVHGYAQPSLVSRNLENRLMDTTEEEKDLLMWTAGGLYAGGSHSTVAIIMSFFLCMLLHPDVQQKAQKELEIIRSEGRLPRMTDKACLPYIECILQEVLRWRPVAPLAAHSTLVDDVYDGITIPAGSVVMANAWAFTHDEDIYESPEQFNPDRFLSQGVPDPRTMVFGFGRRSCPGVYLVDNLLWVVIATTLATLEILPELDEGGKPIIPSAEYTSGAVSHPLPFQCRILPRFSNSEELIADAVASWS
ncbi:hypothetical protein GALMADRAFT_77321 [Galerina marginata CBS 339.88]|uniref:Cytochrome P450 n=1 Tax=Galerina marginata (strain CBS 339.88) TaxID=685588 RepID=A0A067SHS4_GALM3|nr:hypothetical protein GALMADRAFT_77321 [Galerina marginata CBS 339.88]